MLHPSEHWGEISVADEHQRNDVYHYSYGFGQNKVKYTYVSTIQVWIASAMV
jgi:hypothetical protein|tara:strand:- start:208 stop:363 length:156 start_codon:yes stop_codon:yes gene_type:complete